MFSDQVRQPRHHQRRRHCGRRGLLSHQGLRHRRPHLVRKHRQACLQVQADLPRRGRLIADEQVE